MGEVPLEGGWVSGAVRVGSTVRRTPPGTAEEAGFVEALLVELADAGVALAPRFLGRDEQGRQVLSFVEGHVPWRWDRPSEPADVFSDGSLVAVMDLLRRLHEATRRPDGRVALHGDPAPRNTVYRDVPGIGLRPFAFIDWDQAHLGDPRDDVAYALWQFLDLGGPEVRADPPAAARRMRMLADAYGLEEGERLGLVDACWRMMDLCWRGITARAAAGDRAMQRLVEAGAARDVRASADWFAANRSVFDREVG